MSSKCYHIGFVSARLAGTDGVSLEADKWVEVLNRLGHECFCFSGASDWPDERSFIVEEAHFKHPDIQRINDDVFKKKQRDEETTELVDNLKKYFKKKLQSFVDRFDIDLLIVENAWSLPMNIPLGLGLAEFVGDSDIPAIAHHHDFWWDRQRFLGAPADDYLGAAFPVTLSQIQHVVINSVDRRQLSFRKGVSPAMIPNVMNFNSGPPEWDDYSNDMRKELGIPGDSHFILQPTRIVPRKRIEQAIELLKYLDQKCTLVISHEAGDEGMEYLKYIKRYSELMNVPVKFASDRFQQQRGQTDDGKKIYSLTDAYYQSGMVTYPSQIEGFGNAFLETIYYRRPLVMQNYEIFKLDIQPKGFEVITIDGFLTEDVIDEVESVLKKPSIANEWTEKNFQLGQKYYSFETLEVRLSSLLEEAFGRPRNHF